MTAPVVRLFYVDDSGAEDTGWIVYAWVECTAADWRPGLRDWLRLRQLLYREHHISSGYELHASKFIGGRGNPSLDPAWNQRKHLRSVAIEQALAAIADSLHLQVGTVYRRVKGRRGWRYAHAAAGLYAALIRHLDTRLTRDDELGLIVVDGDGTNAHYHAPHRELKLDERHLIEDPFFQDSQRSQWVQIADLVAYTAYQHLHRSPGRSFAWPWYDTYLRDIDVNGGPLEL